MFLLRTRILDLIKAYDKANLEFLMECHVLRGFCHVWCNWIKSVLHNGTVSVKLNNTTRPYFQSHKGLMQEDSLSSLLSLGVGCLSKMVKNT